MTRLPDIALDTLQPNELSLVAGMAARGLRDNPMNVALYGSDPLRRLRALQPLYQWILAAVSRPVLVARRRGVLVGLAAVSPPDHCFYRQTVYRQRTLHLGDLRARVSIPHVPRHLLLPLLRPGPGALHRLNQWGEAGMEHDPQERHQHVELVVVEAALQGLGIGSLMMEQLCREVDRLSYPTHLETDKPDNVRFYEHFGFEVTSEVVVLGVQTWYLHRNQARV